MTSAYTPKRIEKFLSHVGLEHPTHRRYAGEPAADLYFLRQLHTHVISTIPYENLSLHYSRSHLILLDLQALYKKMIIDRNGRGGYCLEVGIFFNRILRGLGFQVYAAAVRARRRGEDGERRGPFGGWTHIVNIVTLSDGTAWMLDVACGGDGPTAPIQLLHGHVQQNLGPQDVRLIHDHIPTQTVRTPESRLWIYQYRNSPELDWITFYAFAEAEAMEADFNLMNWFTGSSPDSFQTYTVLVVKFLRRVKQDGEYEIYGKRMMVNEVVKKNLGGKTKVVQRCQSEAERVEALRAWFGIELSDEGRKGIQGWSTEIRELRNDDRGICE